MVSGRGYDIFAACGILHGECDSKGSCHSVLMRSILRERMRAAVAKIPFVILYDAGVGEQGIGKQGGGISQANQAVVVKINTGFWGDG